MDRRKSTNWIAVFLLAATATAVIAWVTGQPNESAQPQRAFGRPEPAREWIDSAIASAPTPETVQATAAPPYAQRGAACDRAERLQPHAPGGASAQQVEAHTRSWRQTLEGYATALDASGDAQHAIIAASLSATGMNESRLRTVLGALAQNPHDAIIAITVFDECRRPTQKACGPISPEQVLIRADGGNGAAWQRLTTYYLEAGREHEALDALRRISTSPQYNTHSARSVSVALDALAAATSLPYAERVTMAMGVASALPMPDFQPMLKACSERAPDAPPWLEYCLAAGQRMERDAQDALQQLVGIALQSLIHAQTAEVDEHAAASARADAIRERIQQPARNGFDALAARNPKVLEHYLDEWASKGELAAADYAVSAAKAACDSSCCGPAGGP